MRRRLITLAMAGLCCVLWGCVNDPYSQPRIQRRQQHMQEAADGIARRENQAPDRLNQKLDNIDDWWRSDVRRFNERAPMIGDNFW